ncbi:hypothetical protein Bca101_033266 [Brassica carinata]
MLLIDEEGTAIQGFVPAGRVGTFDLTDGVVYKLNNFFAVLDNPPVPFRRIGSGSTAMRSLGPICDSKGDLYDYVGHMKLVNGQTISDHIVLVRLTSQRSGIYVFMFRHMSNGPVMKLYIWDKAASDFCQKFKSYGGTPIVLLVTTEHLLSLQCHHLECSWMSDVQPSKDYLEWLSSNSDIANRVAAEVVTKPETVTLGEIFSYIKQEGSKVAWFECTATIDDVVQGSACKKCGKREVTGVAQYLTKISVYDESEQAVFVVLGDSGKELTGKHASELVASYFESNAGVGADHCVPVPQALLDAIGQKRRFIVKVSDHNLTGKTQTLTVTKILPPEAPQPIEHLEEKTNPSRGFEDAAGDMVRKASERLESGEAKRPKSG